MRCERVQRLGILHEVYTHTAGQSITERRGIGIWNPGKRDSNLNLVAVSPKCSSLGTQTLCEAARQIASIPTLATWRPSPNSIGGHREPGCALSLQKLHGSDQLSRGPLLSPWMIDDDATGHGTRNLPRGSQPGATDFQLNSPRLVTSLPVTWREALVLDVIN